MGVTIAGISAAALAWFDPFNTQFEGIEDARRFTATAPGGARKEVGSVTVMDWNIKFGGGRIDFFFDCHGDRVIMTKAEVIAHLKGIANKINQVDPDILLLQEVDIDSKRTGYVDQVQWLLDHTELSYGAYASQWRSRWIPKHGLGRVNSGNAVLSKWKLSDAKRLALPLIDAQDPVTQYFYLKRNILRTRVDLPGQHPLWVATIHTVAFAQDNTKAKQIAEFTDELGRLDDQGKRFVAGGDLNTIPAGSERTKDFPDSACEGNFRADDFTDDLRRGVLDELYDRYDTAIAPAKYEADNSPYATHTTDKTGTWNRKLDYLFTNGRFAPDSGLVHQDERSGGMATMSLSDHAPVTVVLPLGPS